MWIESSAGQQIPRAWQRPNARRFFRLRFSPWRAAKGGVEWTASIGGRMTRTLAHELLACTDSDAEELIANGVMFHTS
jgi:hypothetical protein